MIWCCAAQELSKSICTTPQGNRLGSPRLLSQRWTAMFFLPKYTSANSWTSATSLVSSRIPWFSNPSKAALLSAKISRLSPSLWVATNEIDALHCLRVLRSILDPSGTNSSNLRSAHFAVSNTRYTEEWPQEDPKV